MGASKLFDGSIEAFEFRDVFCTGDHVDEGTHVVSQIALHRFKLVVSKNDGDLEAMTGIYPQNTFEVFHDGSICHTVELAS